MTDFNRCIDILNAADGCCCNSSTNRSDSIWTTANPVPCDRLDYDKIHDMMIKSQGLRSDATVCDEVHAYSNNTCCCEKKEAPVVRQNFKKIRILIKTPYRDDAEQVIYDLIEDRERCGEEWITVKDLYSHDYIDLPTNYAETKWGWDDLYFLDVKFIRDPSGWIIEMPKAKPINKEEKPMRNALEDCVKKTKFKPGCYDNTDIPFIDRVETYNDRVVKITFIDGTFTKSVCSKNDAFDLDVGITICLMKRWLGKDGNRLYNNLIRKVHKRMDQKERLAEREKKLRAEMREKERKMKAKKAAKKEKARQEQLEIQKQAYIEAFKTIGGVDGQEDDLK